MNPFSDAYDDSVSPDIIVVGNAQPKTGTKAISRDTHGQAGPPKDHSEEEKRSVLASKSTNQQLRRLAPAEATAFGFEVVIPVKRPLPPLPPTKRTRLSSPTGSMAPPGTPKTVDRDDMSKMPKKPQKNKFRHAEIDNRSLRRLSAGLGLGMTMLPSPLGSPGIAFSEVPGPSKTNDNPQKRQYSTCEPSIARVVPMGDVDAVIDPRKHQLLLDISPPAVSWFKEKASSVVSGARKAANRLLKTRDHCKGYQPIHEDPTTSVGKPLRRKSRISSRLMSTKKKLPHDISDHFHRLEGVDSFGEFVGEVSASSNSSNSFLLGGKEDELSLPNGSYVVNYTGSDTVVTTTVSRFEGKVTETTEFMSDSPLAQFTPVLGWKLKRKTGLRLFKEKTASNEEEETDATMSSTEANEIPGKNSLSTVKEIEGISEDELSSSNHPVTHLSPANGKIQNFLAPRPTTKKVVKKIGRANLRGMGGVEKVYGKRVSKVSGMVARHRRGDWIPIEPGINGHKEVVVVDDEDDEVDVVQMADD